MNEGGKWGGQATMRWQYFFLEFMAGRVKVFSKDVDGFSKRSVKELSRFMRMFIKTEHGPEAPCAHSFGLPSCKLNTSLFARAFQSLSQSARVVRVVSLVLSVWILRPQPKRQSSFVCLSFATLRFTVRSCWQGTKGKPPTVYLYMAPAYPLRVCPRVFFSDFGCLIFSPICSRRCEVVCWWLNLSPSSLFPLSLSRFSRSVFICYSLSLCGLFCGLLSLIGSVCPLFSHICVFHVFLLRIFIIICSCLLLLIFAYVMQQAAEAAWGRLF